jgi:hypothetical protein
VTDRRADTGTPSPTETTTAETKTAESTSTQTGAVVPPAAADLDLWQDTLAAEHAVIWSYGLVGATGDLAAPADVAVTSHRQRRSICLDVITGRDAEPVASAAGYDVAKPSGSSAARRLAGDLEGAASASYLGLTSSADRATRLLGARWLRESAVAQQRWTGSIAALPGYDVR